MTGKESALLCQLDVKLHNIKTATTALHKAERDASLPSRFQALWEGYKALVEENRKLVVEKKTREDMIRLGIVPPCEIAAPFMSRLRYLFTGRF